MLVGGRRLRLYAVHTVAPLGPDRDRWRRQLAWLARAVGGERDPVVVAGDLNATHWHRGLSRLLRLDHVLVSPQVGVRAVWEGAGPGSDHLPVLADLAMSDRRPGGASGREGDGLPSRDGPLRPATRRRCRCGRPRAAHEHYRRGTDCALCGPDACPRYRRRWSWRR